MAFLGFEPSTEVWEVQTNPVGYDCIPIFSTIKYISASKWTQKRAQMALSGLKPQLKYERYLRIQRATTVCPCSAHKNSFQHQNELTREDWASRDFQVWKALTLETESIDYNSDPGILRTNSLLWNEKRFWIFFFIFGARFNFPMTSNQLERSRHSFSLLCMSFSAWLFLRLSDWVNLRSLCVNRGPKKYKK